MVHEGVPPIPTFLMATGYGSRKSAFIPTFLIMTGYGSRKSAIHTHFPDGDWVWLTQICLLYPLFPRRLGMAHANLPPIPTFPAVTGYGSHKSASHTHFPDHDWVWCMRSCLPYPLSRWRLGMAHANLPPIPTFPTATGYGSRKSASYTHFPGGDWV